MQKIKSDVKVIYGGEEMSIRGALAENPDELVSAAEAFIASVPMRV